jgi:peroxiredoxin Q/BCP
MKVLITAVVLALIVVITMIEEQSGVLNIGDEAPDFSGKLSTGETIRLSDYRGKKNVVLFFYPKDFTAGCTAEVCSFRDNYSEVTALDAIMFGVSHDGESSHAGFIEKHSLPFQLISDPGKSIINAYGATRLGGMLPRTKRITYVIDTHGVIRGVIHHEVQIGSHIEEVIQVLQKL